MRKDRKKWRLLQFAGAAGILLLGLAAAVLAARDTGGRGVVINEILAANSAFPDPSGRYRDFVELYNGSDRAADLSGCGLTDSEKTVKYRFPAGTVIPAGGYLTVWCDASAGPEEGCAAFSVSKDGGETLRLLSRRDAELDRAETLPAARNESMVPDGTGGWTLSDTPTPGFENSPAGYQAYLAARAGSGFSLRISEFMSGNSLYPAPDGAYYDWIELRNDGEADAVLDGFHLSDTDRAAKYAFPAGETVPAGGYLTVWCGAGGTGFSLDRAGGETLCLLGPEGELVDRVLTPALEKNRAYALGADGVWTVTARATLGFENTPEGYAAYVASRGCGDCAVVISEVMAENRGCIPDSFGAFSDWIELYNAGDADAALEGWYLSDDPAAPDKWRVPALTVPAGGYALIFCDGKNTVTDGECHAGFSLSSSGETLTLSTPVGSPAAVFAFGALGADRSAVNAGGQALTVDAPTPGYENSAEGYLAFQNAREAPGPLVINEVMSSNGSVLRQADGRYYDWAEIKNISGEPVELSGFTLTDDPARPDRFVFPEKTLSPGETCVVLLRGGSRFSTAYLCADFALNGEEDWLYLYDAGGGLLDFLRAAGQPYGGSVGRMEGENGYFLFDEPTPGQENRGGARAVAAAPEPDAAPGVYEGVAGVTVALTGPGEIRYTTDGSLPTAESPLYEAPFYLTETTVIRARSFTAGSLPGQTATLNYLINEGHTLPVVCLSLAPGDFNGPGGIYRDVREDREVPANVAFFPEDGTEGFRLDCGVKLHGAGSRLSYAKKSMKLVFRARYGGELSYDVFGDGEITGFSSLLLRGGSLLNGNVLLKDAFASMVAIAASDHVLALNARYAVLYVNGQYWGIHCIREAYSERYGADHLGAAEEDIRVSRAPVTAAPHSDLYAHINSVARESAGGQEGYDAVAEWLDLESLADWMIFEAYFMNYDIPGNIRYIWSAADGKWRYALFDLDESLYGEDADWGQVFSDWQHGRIPLAMTRNPVFRNQLLRRLAELLSDGLSPERVAAVLEDIHARLSPEIPREAAKWGGEAYWESTYTRIMGYIIGGRGEKVARSLGRYLRLTDEEFEEYFGEAFG